MPLAHYFLGQRVLGASPVPSGARSHCFFCPSCADIWGRIMVEGAEYAELHRNSCERHANACVPTWGQLPGSFILSRMLDPLAHIHSNWASQPLVPAHFPLEVLHRELDLAVAVAASFAAD